MKVSLFDFQKEALHQLRDKLTAARNLASSDNPQAIGRIQLIRKQASPAGGEHFVRLEINKAETIKRLLLITSNPQMDALFAKLGT